MPTDGTSDPDGNPIKVTCSLGLCAPHAVRASTHNECTAVLLARRFFVFCFVFYKKKKKIQHISHMSEERNDMSVHPGMQAGSRAADVLFAQDYGYDVMGASD